MQGVLPSTRARIRAISVCLSQSIWPVFFLLPLERERDRTVTGLIKDYYAARVALVAKVGVAAAKAGRHQLDPSTVNKAKAELSYNWTLSQSLYPTDAIGHALTVSKKMHAKYSAHFSHCARTK